LLDNVLVIVDHAPAPLGDIPSRLEGVAPFFEQRDRVDHLSGLLNRGVLFEFMTQRNQARAAQLDGDPR